jgi:peptidyl-tRNA hydrolase ICT1
VSSSDSITIQCDSSRSQPENTEETHRKLAEEIKRIYKKRVPGITTPEQKARIEQL